MNFAAQLFATYLTEGLHSPRPAIEDSEECDPFWQRWEITTCDPPDPPDLSPSQINPVGTGVAPAERTNQPPPQDPEKPQHPAVLSLTPKAASALTATVHPPLPPGPSLPSASPCGQPTQKDTFSILQSLPPHLDCTRKSTKPSTLSQILPNPCLAAPVPKSKASNPQSHSCMSPQTVNHKPPHAPRPTAARASPSAFSPTPSSSSSSASCSPLSSTPAYGGRGELLPPFQALVDFLLRLVLSFLLLFLPR